MSKRNRINSLVYEVVSKKPAIPVHRLGFNAYPWENDKKKDADKTYTNSTSYELIPGPGIRAFNTANIRKGLCKSVSNSGKNKNRSKYCKRFPLEKIRCDNWKIAAKCQTKNRSENNFFNFTCFVFPYQIYENYPRQGINDQYE